nr:basic proline-rich protein-like [Camelus dromedarius]
MGPKTPIRSLGEASSFTVQMRSFQGHVCTGPAGVRGVSGVRVRVSVSGGSLGALAGATPVPPQPRTARAPAAPRLPPLRFPAPGPGPDDLAPPRPSPTLRRATARRRRRRRPAPRPGGGRTRHGPTPPCPPGSPRIGVPHQCTPHLTPPPPSLIRWQPRTTSHRWPRRIAGSAPARPPDHTTRQPRGLPGPAQRPREAREPGGGRGAGRAGCHFCRRRGACAGPSPAPPPLPAGRVRETDYSGSGLRPPAPRPQAQAGPGYSAGQEGGGPAPGPWRRRAGHGLSGWRRGPRGLYRLELEPGGGGRGGGRAGAGRTGGAPADPRGHKTNPQIPRAAPASPARVAARQPWPRERPCRLRGSEACPEPVLPAARAPRRLPSPHPPPAGLRAATSALITCGRWGRAARLRALVRGAASARPLLSRRRRRRRRRPRALLPSRPPACLARSLPPSLGVAPLSPPPPPGPPSHPFFAFLLPSLRPRGPRPSAAARPPGALARTPALRSRPGGAADWGAPGAAAEGGARPRQRPRPDFPALLPRWGSPHAAGRRTRTRGAPTPRWARAPRLGRAPGHSAGGLRQPSPPRGAPLPGTASALGPRIQHWPQGQRPLLSPGRCQVPPPWQPAEPPAAFALQFSGPPPEPTALCLPQHWGWGQQRRPIRAATPTPPATPARCRRRVDASPLSRAKVGAPGPS